MPEKCILFDRDCIECGECDMCPYHDKICDNCFACLAFESTDIDYAKIAIDEIIIDKSEY